MVHYEERQPMPLWGAIIGVAAITAVGLLRTPGILVALGTGAALAPFRALEVRVTDEALEFGFGPIRKRFPIAKVVACEPYPIRFREFGGLGIRLNLRGDICYNTRFGEGTRVTIEGGRRYVLSVPESVLRPALERAGAPLAAVSPPDV